MAMRFSLGDEAMQLKFDKNCQSPEESFSVENTEESWLQKLVLPGQVENCKITTTKKDQ